MAACVRWRGWSEAPVANCFNSIEAPQPVQKTQPEPGRAAGDLPAAWLDCMLCPRHRANHLCPVTTGRPSHAWGHAVKHTQASILSVDWSLSGQAWSSGLACVLHPGPSPGTLPLSLVQHGTSAQLAPVPCPHPQVPAGTCLCLQGPAGSGRHSSAWGRWPRHHLHWHAMEMAEPAVGEGTLGALSTAVKQRLPSPAQAERPGEGGSLGTDGTLGGVLKTPSHPVFKAPAISLPCHWPGHSKAKGTSPQATQGVHMCSAAPASARLLVQGGENRDSHLAPRLLRKTLIPQPRSTAWVGFVLLYECAMCMCMDDGSPSPCAHVSLGPALLTHCRD